MVPGQRWWAVVDLQAVCLVQAAGCRPCGALLSCMPSGIIIAVCHPPSLLYISIIPLLCRGCMPSCHPLTSLPAIVIIVTSPCVVIVAALSCCCWGQAHFLPLPGPPPLPPPPHPCLPLPLCWGLWWHWWLRHVQLGIGQCRWEFLQIYKLMKFTNIWYRDESNSITNILRPCKCLYYARAHQNQYIWNRLIMSSPFTIQNIS